VRGDDESSFKPRLALAISPQNFRDRVYRRFDRQHVESGGSDTAAAQ
jgi:hypothetical protein